MQSATKRIFCNQMQTVTIEMSNTVVILHNRLPAQPTPDEQDVMDQVQLVQRLWKRRAIGVMYLTWATTCMKICST